MEEIFIIIISFIGELLIDALLYFPWDIFVSSHENRKNGGLNKFAWAICSLIIGITIGAISVQIFSTAVLPFSWLRVINLIIAPLIAGGIALRLSKKRFQKNISSDNKLHYLVAFLFTLGLLGTRFILTVKT